MPVELSRNLATIPKLPIPKRLLELPSNGAALVFARANVIIGVLLVGLASTVATIPLVAHNFATISIVGILINPAVIVLANIVVLAGVVALAVPWVGVVAEAAAEWQNRLVEWAAALPYGHFDATIPEWTMWVIYALYAVATIIFWSAPKEEKEPKIEG